MSDVLTIGEAIARVASAWEEEAEVIERSLPGNAVALRIRRDADTIRRLADDSAPDEVPLGVVRDRTGWSHSYLVSRCTRLQKEGRARKRGRTWWITREAALEIPVKDGHQPSFEGAESLEDLADRIVASTSR